MNNFAVLYEEITINIITSKQPMKLVKKFKNYIHPGIFNFQFQGIYQVQNLSFKNIQELVQLPENLVTFHRFGGFVFQVAAFKST